MSKTSYNYKAKSVDLLRTLRFALFAALEAQSYQSIPSISEVRIELGNDQACLHPVTGELIPNGEFLASHAT